MQTARDTQATITPSCEYPSLLPASLAIEGFLHASPLCTNKPIPQFNESGKPPESIFPGTAPIMDIASNAQKTIPAWLGGELARYREERQAITELSARGRLNGVLDDPVLYAEFRLGHAVKTQLEIQFLFATCTDTALASVVNDPLLEKDGMRVQALAIIEFRNRHTARQQKDDYAKISRALQQLPQQQLMSLLRDFPEPVLAYLADDMAAGKDNPMLSHAALNEYKNRQIRA